MLKWIKQVQTVVKTPLVGIMVLSFILVATVPSVFAQEVPANPGALITNLLEQSESSVAGAIAGVDSPSQAGLILYDLGVTEYRKALAALENGDAQGANDHAIVAMSIFEEAIQTINENAAPIAIERGQGIGLGNLPNGLNVAFNLQESITNSENDANNLQNVISNNGLDISLNNYNNKINLAKELLAAGDLPNAQAQYELAQDVIDDLTNQLLASTGDNQEFVDSAIAEVEAMLARADNLGTSQAVINKLEAALETLNGGDWNEISELTSEGGELDNLVSVLPDNVTLPPGFGAAEDNPNEQATTNGRGLGLGLEDKLPPGIAKRYGVSGDSEFDLETTGDDSDTPGGDNGETSGTLDFFSTLSGFEAALANIGLGPSEQGLLQGQGVGLGNAPKAPGILKKLENDYFLGSDDDFSPDDDIGDGEFEDDASNAKKKKGKGKEFGQAKAAAAKEKADDKKGGKGKGGPPEDPPGGGPPGGGPPGGGPPGGGPPGG